jgi:hypothetical protein
MEERSAGSQVFLWTLAVILVVVSSIELLVHVKGRE